ncbi:PAS domain-containing protein [Caldinitratiruptor microaerophilus]|uniref:PAS domain-containing protein n=1 Tax=Caldinitratiruptor microaerophilus TaxID=671077 RepID=A0AA35CMJ7_9FIRM|nr:PAS domain-containing protein [Caldinitratiruptor microaerophilus]BDG60327.1 hypothetical protein caldi_14170 [Caldinitratiruptor microaerophilus]
MLTWLFALAGVWTGTVYYALFAVAVLVTGCADEARGRVDLAAVTLAGIEAVVGALLLAVPGAFTAPYYDPIRPALRLVGLMGLVGAAGLLVSEWSAGRLAVWGCRIVGAVFPLVIAGTLLQTRIWTGVTAWGAWVPTLLLGRWEARQEEAETPTEGEATDAAAVDRLLETWTWFLAVGVVATTALGGELAVTVPSVAHASVAATSVWNFAVHTVLSGLLTPGQRVPWRMGFLTLAIGVLLGSAGYAGHGFMMLLVVLPPLATRMAGLRGGLRTLAMGLAAVTLEEIGEAHGGGHGYLEAAAAGVANAVILAVAAGVGIRSANEMRTLVQNLREAHESLNGAYADLPVANEELLAQQEELAAQQQQIEAQNRELHQRHEELEVERDRLASALRSLQEETETRRRLAAIVEETTDLVIVADTAGRPVYWNRAAASIRGLGTRAGGAAISFLRRTACPGPRLSSRGSHPGGGAGRSLER